jgi:hypothetical protein
MHQGVTTYLDGNLFLAPLNDPRTILDIGYASSESKRSKAWRIGALLMTSFRIKGPVQGYGKSSPFPAFVPMS